MRSPLSTISCHFSSLCPDGMDPSSDRGVRGQPPFGQCWKAGHFAGGSGTWKCARKTVTLAPENGDQDPGTQTGPKEKKQCTWASASTSVARWLERLIGSQKKTQTPRRKNISTPSVADASGNNSSNIESSTGTHQRTSLYAHPYDCCRVAASAQALRRTGALARARTPTCPFF